MGIVKDLLLIFLSAFLLIKCIILHKKIFQQKEYFIKTLTHDFRVLTLAQINGLKCLELYCKNNSKNELIEDIKNSCSYSLDMVSMLQYIYRFENGENILNYEIFDLNHIINFCLNSISDVFKEKGVKIVINKHGNTCISADKYFIQKLIITLLNISLNYTSKNSVITLNMFYQNKRVIVEITYSGNAVTAEEYRRMFSINPVFSTVGHGIRMFFCKKIVEFHRGKIKLKCNKNETNGFTIILPVKTNVQSGVSLVPKRKEAYN